MGPNPIMPPALTAAPHDASPAGAPSPTTNDDNNDE
eukprot:gene42366-46360_t